MKNKDEKMKWPCKQCNFFAKAPSTLEHHMRKHTKEKPYECEFCNYSTGHQGALHKHTRHHIDDKPYKCELCSFSASYRSLLRYHMRIHTGETPFECSQCDFKSAHLGSLHTHLKIHDGVRPQKCDYCDYTTAYPSGLKRHYARCSGMPSELQSIYKPFNCELCSFSAPYPSLLRIHTRTHDRAHPHKCEHCDYTAAYPKYLKKHYNKCLGKSSKHQSSGKNATSQPKSIRQCKKEKTTSGNFDSEATDGENIKLFIKTEPAAISNPLVDEHLDLAEDMVSSQLENGAHSSRVDSPISGSRNKNSGIETVSNPSGCNAALRFNISSIDRKYPEQDTKIYVCSKCNYCTLLHSDLLSHKTAAHTDL